MKRLYHKTTAALLVGGYLLVVTVGGAFHTHLGQDCCTADGESAADAQGHVCHAGHSHEILDCSSKPSDSPTFETAAVPFDSHCPICSFLSQKPIPVTVQVAEISAELGQPVVRVRAISPSDDIPSTVFSRGPPVA